MRMIVDVVFWKEGKRENWFLLPGLWGQSTKPSIYGENVGFMLSWTKVATNKDRFSFMREKWGKLHQDGPRFVNT